MALSPKNRREIEKSCSVLLASVPKVFPYDLNRATVGFKKLNKVVNAYLVHDQHLDCRTN